MMEYLQPVTVHRKAWPHAIWFGTEGCSPVASHDFRYKATGTGFIAVECRVCRFRGAVPPKFVEVAA